MELKDIKTLSEISQEFDIPVPTLKTRLTLKSIGLVEGVDYRKLSKGQSILFSPEGVRKITQELRGGKNE